MSEHKIVFVSYWTSKYEKAAKRLEASLDKHGLEHDIQEAEDEGWYANVRKKPTFILEMMKKHSDAYAIVWIDADGDVIQRPDLFFGIKEDFAARFLNWRSKDKELLSGTVFCRNTPAMIKAMQRWIRAIKKDTRELSCPEQRILQEILPKLKISVKELPEEYCHIIPKTNQGRGVVPRAIIAHYQFSRETRYGRTPAAHLSNPTKIANSVRDRARSAPKGAVRPPRPKRVALPRPPRSNRHAEVRRSRTPASITQAERRKEINALREKKNKKIVEDQKAQRAIRMAAIARSRENGLARVKSEVYGTDAQIFVGGVRGHPPSPKQQRRADVAMSLMGHASDLDGCLPKDSTVIVMGNSPTINVIPPDLLEKVPVIGCNRALRYEEFWPDFLVIGDREPYCQERNSGRLERAAKSGIKLILADSIFDPSILHRGPWNNVDRRAQPKPDFGAHLYRIGPREKKTWSYDLVERGSKYLPINLETFSKPVVGCQNVVGSLLAAAAILGAKRIIVIGIELKWPGRTLSHFYGDGKEVGAYQQTGSMDSRILPSLAILKTHLDKKGVEVVNLSPNKGSPFAKVFATTPAAGILKELKDVTPWKTTDE